jgi:DNA-directed RNA polymerase, mitochondrial
MIWTDAEWTEKLARQEELEQQASVGGRERFMQRLEDAQEKGRGSMVGAAKRLLVEAIAPVEAALDHAMREASERVPQQRPKAYKWVNLLGTDVTAFLTVRVVLDGVHEGKQDLSVVIRSLTRHILNELKYRRFKEQAPGLFHYRLNSFETDSYAHRSRSMNAAMRYAGVDVSDLDMDQKEQLAVGNWLIHIMLQATGMVEQEREVVREGRKTKTHIYLTPSPETSEWLTQRNGLLSELTPLKTPMVVPPLRWRQGDRGGYRFNLRSTFPLIRGWTQGSSAEREDLPVVMGALNRLQDTAWVINQDVYRLITDIMGRDGGMCGLPSLQEEPLPSLFDTFSKLRREGGLEDVRIVGDVAEGPEAQVKALHRQHRYELGKVRNRNHARYLSDLTFRRTMKVADTMSQEEAFWFVYNCDFRGRVYPIADFLSPQGADLEKALLTFADKRPMGRDGGRWLAVHMMNSLDETPGGTKVSTMTLDERMQWVLDNEELVLQAGRDPWADLWWAEAGDPLQFYAACAEWARWAAAGYSEDHLSGLPVAMDGSCNGLQHFAAMFRDEVGARAVNVSPGSTPQDVYLRVANTVLDKLEREAGGNEMARLWLTSGLVNRKLCKRPTMTFGYGSKPFGMTYQLIEYLQKDCDYDVVEDHFATLDEATGELESRSFGACSYMAQAIWEALGDVVVKAFEAMHWLQVAARAIASSNKPVMWRVPLTGFPVRQGYFESNMRRLDTVLSGSVRIQLSYHEQTDNVNAVKQANAIAPNVVHSLDAAALMLTVNAASAEGIESFAMVHDSYGTTPGDAQLLADVLRQEFVGLYEHDVPNMLREQWAAQVDDPTDIPPPPAPGSLDLAGVLVSSYFFA